jgi:hypothetical protein
VSEADYLDPMFPASQLPTIIPGAPVSPPPSLPAPAAQALEEIDRVLQALGKMG